MAAFGNSPPAGLSLVRAALRTSSILVFGYDAFISHSHQDGRRYAGALWRALEERGFTVCFDRRDFHSGERLTPTVRRTVQSSRDLVLLDTPAARLSEWVEREIATALVGPQRVIAIRHESLRERPWARSLADDDPSNPHLTEDQLSRLNDSLREIDSAQGFESGTCDPAIVASLVKTLTYRTVKRKFFMLALGVGVLLTSIGLLNGASWWTGSTLARISSELKNPTVPFQTAHSSLEDLLTSEAALIPRTWAHSWRADELNDLLDLAYRSRIKVTAGPPADGGVRISPGGSAVVTWEGQNFAVHAAQTWNCRFEQNAHANGVAVDDTGKWVAEVGPSSARVWDTVTCQPLPVIVQRGSTPVEPIVDVGFTDDAKSLVVVWRQHVAIWRRDGTSFVATKPLQLRTALDAASPARFLGLAVAGAGNRAVVLAADETSNVADGFFMSTSDKGFEWNPESGSSPVDVTLDASGRYLVSAGLNGDVAVWDLDEAPTPGITRTPRYTKRANARDVQFVGKANAVLVRGSDGSLLLSDVPSLNRISTHPLSAAGAGARLLSIEVINRVYRRPTVLSNVEDFVGFVGSNELLYESEGSFVSCSLADETNALNCKKVAVSGLGSRESMMRLVGRRTGTFDAVTSERNVVRCSTDKRSCFVAGRETGRILATCDRKGLVYDAQSGSGGTVLTGGPNPARWTLPDAAQLGAPAASTPTAAAFDEACNRLGIVFGGAENARLVVLKLDEVSSWGGPPVKLALYRTIEADVRSLMFERNDTWALIAVATETDVLVERIPLNAQGIVEWLNGADADAISRTSIVGVAVHDDGSNAGTGPGSAPGP